MSRRRGFLNGNSNDGWYWSPDPSKKFELPRNRANEALASKKYVKSCMRNILEKKTICVQNCVGAAGVPGAGRVDPLGSFNILQGTGDGNRTGNFVKLTKVWFRFFTLLPVGVPTALYRVIIFRDSNTNGATPAFLDVLDATGGGAAGYNDDNVTKVGGARFKILHDRWFAVNSSLGAADASSGSHNTAWTLTFLNPGAVQYDTFVGNITDIVSGEIFILTYCNAATGVVNCSAQIEFQDS